MRVLLTGIGAPGTPGTVHCLRNGGPVRIIGCDADPDPDNAHLVDAVYHVPRPDNPEYLDEIASICIWESVDVVLPQTTAEVEFLSRTKHQRHLLDAGARVACANGHAVKGANDKAHVMEAFAAIGLPSPEFLIISDRQWLYEAKDRFGLPFVIKPRSSNGSRGVRIVRDDNWIVDHFLTDKPDGLSTTMTAMSLILAAMESDEGGAPELIAMEFLPGDEFSVDVFRGLHAQAAVPRLRKKMRGGICTHAVVEMRQDLINYSLKAAKHLALTGAFGFQYRLDGDGVPKVIECNPRVQGTMCASYYAGLNAPWLAVREAMMDHPTEINLIDGNIEFRRCWSGVGFVDEVAECV